MASTEPVSRNAPCTCGSGKRYKRCCGNLADPAEQNTAGDIGNTFSNTGQGPKTEEDSHYQPEAITSSDVRPESPKEQDYSDGTALVKSGQFKQAKKKFEDILKKWPAEAKAQIGLGLCLVELGQVEVGLEEARKAVKLDPGNLELINELTVMLFNQGRVEESLEWAQRAVKMGPEGARTNVIIANCYEKLHRIDEALEANMLAQVANPQVKYLKLQEAKLRARNGDYERAREILQATSLEPGLPSELRSQVFNELGMVLDKLESYDQAYEAFRESGLEAARRPETQKFKLDYRPSLINAYVNGLTRERINRFQPAELQDGGWTRVFLVGFPRSGTTMTEQILAAHSGIRTTEEQPYVEHLRYEWARMVGAKLDMGWMADKLSVESILQLRETYRAKVEADQGTPIGSNIIVDKLPLNIINIGLINMVFPDAKVIVALRDPRDSCLSCFMQDFKLNSAMIHFLTLDRTVKFYAQVMEAWLHFREIITLSHLDIRYEDTVQNFEFEAKRIIDYLGLDWEPEISQFHQVAKDRVIATPSYVAVTEPVHTRAIGRWRNYSAQFAHLIPQLERFIKAFGYEVET
jgi:tetratricopeptide (TPR) repeat protein